MRKKIKDLKIKFQVQGEGAARHEPLQLVAVGLVEQVVDAQFNNHFLKRDSGIIVTASHLAAPHRKTFPDPQVIHKPGVKAVESVCS